MNMPQKSWSITLICLTCLLLCALAFGQPPTPQGITISRHPIHHLRQPKTHTPFVLPAMPSGPLPQVPMDQLPSAPPQVTFRDGLLTIVAQNSTLGDILREVHKRTGATIDAPPNATERVATKVGPGPARDVLASLLNGTAFNYVMVGSTSDPSSLTTVVITAKPAGGPAGQVANNTYQPPPQFAQQVVQLAPGTGPGGPVAAQPAGDEEADAEEPDADENADEEQDQDQADTTGAGAQNVAQPNAGPKTPEQILEMLRNRQQPQGPGQQVTPLPQVTPHMPPDQNEPQ
jgi:hypothetical protein